MVVEGTNLFAVHSLPLVISLKYTDFEQCGYIINEKFHDRLPAHDNFTCVLNIIK